MAAETCGWGDLLCEAKNAANGALEQAAEDTVEAWNTMFTEFFTSWVTDPPAPVIGGNAAEWMALVTGPLQALLITAGLIAAAIRTFFSVRGEPLAQAGPRLLRAILIASVGAAFIGLLVPGSTEFARWILKMAQLSAAPEGLGGDMAAFGGNVILALVFGALGLLLVGIQWAIMFFRAIALTVITPFWPVAAAGAMFDKHQASFDKITAWLLAFILYSPIAACLYGLAIVLREGTDGVEGVIYGLSIFCLAIACLPALVKLVAPVATAVGNASAGGMMFGMARVVVAAGAIGATVATAGAAAPATVPAAGAATGAGGAASGAAGATATEGAATAAASSTSTAAPAAATTAEPAGASVDAPTGDVHLSAGAGASSSSGGSQGAPAGALRELSYLLPQGGQNSLRDTFDE